MYIIDASLFVYNVKFDCLPLLKERIYKLKQNSTLSLKFHQSIMSLMYFTLFNYPTHLDIRSI